GNRNRRWYGDCYQHIQRPIRAKHYRVSNVACWWTCERFYPNDIWRCTPSHRAYSGAELFGRECVCWRSSIDIALLDWSQLWWGGRVTYPPGKCRFQTWRPRNHSTWLAQSGFNWKWF